MIYSLLLFVFWVGFFCVSRAELLRHVEEQLAAHYRQDRTEAASCSVAVLLARTYPGTSLVRAGCFVVTGGSFEGGQDSHGDRLLTHRGFGAKRPEQ